MSDQSERKGEHKGGDLLGLFLSGVGGLFLVSILLSFGEREPKDVIWTAPVVGLIEGIGRAAGLLLSAGVALIGTALFLGRRGTGLGRHLFALLGAALGLALLLGGLIPSGAPGGLLGRSLPDLLPGLPGRLLGALIGLGVAAASAAALWPAGRARGAARSSPGERATLAPTLESRHGGEGVSAAEAEALIPAPLARATLAPMPVPSSPFPRDVRLEGRVPPGARPLGTGQRAAPRSPAPAYQGSGAEPHRDERASYAPGAAPTVGQYAGSSIADVRPVESTAGGPAQPSWERAARVPVEPAEPWENPSMGTQARDALSSTGTVDESEPDDAPPQSAAVQELQELAPERTPARPPRAAGRAQRPRATTSTAGKTKESVASSDEAPEAVAPKSQSPTWEQVGLFDGPAVQDEPASVHAAQSAAVFAPHAIVASDDDLEAADAAEARSEAGEPQAAYDDDYETGDDDVESDDDDDDDDDDEDEDEDEKDEEDEDDEEEEEEDEDADELDLAEDGAAALAGADEEPDEPAAEPEPEKVLAPAVPSRPALEPAAAFGRLDFEQLVHEAGCVVIDQNRVAVSMLQRTFQIDFDQACAVLDQLQERGLIGPYMGGRTRDILLTREKWVAQAPVV